MTIASPAAAGNYANFEIDPCAVVLPRALFVSLAEALRALRSGEVQELLRPADTRTHGEAWSWEQARLRACQYVAFLNGKGLKKIAAQNAVCSASGIGVETLRSYEKAFRKNPSFAEILDVAKKAGEFLVLYEGKKIDSIQDPQLAFTVDLLLSQTLSGFGDSYRKDFGHRHNQAPGADYA